MKTSVFWFRRDLRLVDNTALYYASQSGYPVLPVFIFDENILEELPPDDARIKFIYDSLEEIHNQLLKEKSSLICLKGDPYEIWEKLLSEFDIAEVYVNKDYEPYARERDDRIRALLEVSGVSLKEFKDQVIFEENEILKNNGQPYSVFTPYKKKWLEQFNLNPVHPLRSGMPSNFHTIHRSFPSLSELGFRQPSVTVREYDLSGLDQYAETRNYPGMDSTTYLGPHLRFGTISVRQVIERLGPSHETFLGELIWREFFMQILYHYQGVVNQNFNPRYNGIQWRNEEKEFKRWCEGKTGYPMVDAGMRQLNATGYMHNRVRMVVAGFLCKHLLIDWRWGESYFARLLHDYELSSNNGNWQWAAGTGCDAAPYFRIFNPAEQLRKFDKDRIYVKRWIPELGSPEYPEPMMEHQYARARALETYKKGITTQIRET
jgi:deoxyribodipyrimidine photo-lyase